MSCRRSASVNPASIICDKRTDSSGSHRTPPSARAAPKAHLVEGREPFAFKRLEEFPGAVLRKPKSKWRVGRHGKRVQTETTCQGSKGEPRSD
jgi:hypothetical protein